uniref:Uncharacterized protein n=1 Tax=Anguilla anguilla TaxID=7936 RepID=A0A0E9SH35_ANGAN
MKVQGLFFTKADLFDIYCTSITHCAYVSHRLKAECEPILCLLNKISSQR